MPIRDFLTEIETLLKTGSATEHSYRPALQRLFTSVLVGIQALNEPKHERYGAPDFVLLRGSVPVGHVEAKDIGVTLDPLIVDSDRDTPKTVNGKQLRRYRAALPNLLYTDGLVWYWFAGGNLRTPEPLILATWNAVTKKLTPTPTGINDLRNLLDQFALNTGMIVSKPRELAERLARIAHWLRDLIRTVFQEQTDEGALHQQLDAFKKTLLPNLKPDEFADMYAQTIVYGLFAARIERPNTTTFSRIDAAMTIPPTNPFLRSLFQQIAGFDLDERIAWLVDECATLLAHTDMAEVMRDFGRATRQEDPVVHFYETFLAAYDPTMREKRGVYYTPEPVVSFIVRSVHTLLQREFHKPFGLADDATIILDPATGTATFLNTVIQQIHQEISDQGLAGTWDQYVREKLLNRVFGFELLMAPYTIAHLKLGNLLKQLGYTPTTNQRLGVYLTNALADAPSLQEGIAAFVEKIAAEGKAANEVKHTKNVMVVLGNPPYSGHSANTSTWISELLRGKLPQGQSTENYYAVDGAPLGERNPKWLQDDYVKFIRFGEWRIAQTGEGILAYISNNGYLDNPTFRGMRESLLKDFDTIYILNLHGNSKKRERTPDGGIDQNVFDIQQGVAIGIFIKKQGTHEELATVYYADIWGEREGKYAVLNSEDITSIQWQSSTPIAPLYQFLPQSDDNNLKHEYECGYTIKEAIPINILGYQTHRDHFAVDFTWQSIKHKIDEFMDSHLSDHYLQTKYGLQDNRDWKLTRARQVISQEPDLEKLIVKTQYRPFDIRYTYLNEGFSDYPRYTILKHLRYPNLALATMRQTKAVQWKHCLITDSAIPAVFVEIKDGNSVFPLYIYPDTTSAEPSMFDADYQVGQRRANLSPTFIAEFAKQLGLEWIDDGCGDLVTTFGPEDVFHYMYAIFHSPTYRERYAEFLKIDFPRLPLTSDPAMFKALVQLGAQLVDLHLLRLPNTSGIGGAGGAAILQAPGRAGVSFPTGGTNIIEKVTYITPHGRCTNGGGLG